MKIRTDFVANSSSSSFIIARKGKSLTKKQRAAVLRYVEEKMLGESLASYETEDGDLQYPDFCLDEDGEEAFEKAKAAGWLVTGGRVDFEEAEWQIAALYQELWDAIEEADPDAFVQIDTSLSY